MPNYNSLRKIGNGIIMWNLFNKFGITTLIELQFYDLKFFMDFIFILCATQQDIYHVWYMVLKQNAG